jgi:hypothetical protein
MIRIERNRRKNSPAISPFIAYVYTIEDSFNIKVMFYPSWKYIRFEKLRIGSYPKLLIGPHEFIQVGNWSFKFND